MRKNWTAIGLFRRYYSCFCCFFTRSWTSTTKRNKLLEATRWTSIRNINSHRLQFVHYIGHQVSMCIERYRNLKTCMCCINNIGTVGTACALSSNNHHVQFTYCTSIEHTQISYKCVRFTCECASTNLDERENDWWLERWATAWKQTPAKIAHVNKEWHYTYRIHGANFL